nr:uncharacterized protein LOC117856266 [Setaria viridis]
MSSEDISDDDVEALLGKFFRNYQGVPVLLGVLHQFDSWYGPAESEEEEIVMDDSDDEPSPTAKKRRVVRKKAIMQPVVYYEYMLCGLLRDCTGAIDGTHVLARFSLKMQATFRGRKHTITQNVLAAVDFDLRADGLTVPQGKFYLVDAGYAVGSGFLPPYRCTRHGQDEHVPIEAAWTPNSTDTPLSQNIVLTMEPRHNKGMHGLHKCGRIGDLLEFNSTEVLGVHVLLSSIDEFVICSETLDMAVMGEEVVGVVNEAGAEGGVAAVEEGNPAAPPPNGAQPGGPMQWSSVQSAFMLRRFHDLVGQVARMVFDFAEVNVTTNQIYNHLRKWRQRWVKIARLKDLSGALWNEDHHMIVLEEEHLIGHTKDHPVDAKFLNTPIENYVQMEAIFGSSQATGRFAMGSNEPLGVPTDLGHLEGGDVKSETINLDRNEGDSGKQNAASNGLDTSKSSDDKEGRGGKRRKLGEEEYQLMHGMTVAVASVADALKAPQHNEVYEDLYGCVMSCPGYSQEALMFALVYLLKIKAEGLCFVQMSEAHRILWLRTYLSQANFL